MMDAPYILNSQERGAIGMDTLNQLLYPAIFRGLCLLRKFELLKIQ
jgi:hypothetical protein